MFLPLAVPARVMTEQEQSKAQDAQILPESSPTPLLLVGPINKYLLANGSARPRILPRYYGLFPPPLWHHVLDSSTVVKAGRAEPRREKPAVEFIDPSYGGHRLWGRIAYGCHSNGYRKNGGDRRDETEA